MTADENTELVQDLIVSSLKDQGYEVQSVGDGIWGVSSHKDPQVRVSLVVQTTQ